MRGGIIGLVVAACALGGCVKVPPMPPHGVGVGSALYCYRTLGDLDRMDTMVDLAAAAGMRWTREEFHWEWIETEPGVLDVNVLARYDHAVQALRKANISILGLLAYDSAWSPGQDSPASEAEREDYARFASAMVERYRASVHYWEVWNEPNLDHFWKPKADAKAYAALLHAAHDAIKQTDPDAKVVGCATSGVALDFIRDVLDAGGGAWMDVLSIHPYSGNQSTDVTEERGEIRRLRTMLADRGLNLPLWVSEVGFQTSTNENGVSEGEQGGALARTWLTLFVEGVDVAISYDFVDDGVDLDEAEQNFGVLHQDLSPKPAYAALTTTASLLAGTTFLRRADVGVGAEALEFSLPDGRRLWAVWSLLDDPVPNGGSLENLAVVLPVSGTVERVVGLDGNERPLPPAGCARIVPTRNPVFVLVRP